MMIAKRLAALAALLILSSATAALDAQTENTGVLQAQIDSLTNRLNRVEKKTGGWDKLLANLPKISGYGIMGYEWNGTTEASTSSFNVMSVRLSLAGEIGSKVDYKFQFEFVSPKLMDAYVRYKPWQEFGLQVGQFHTNFALEGPMAPTDMEAIDYAPIVKTVCIQMHDPRDIGIAAFGSCLPRNGYNILEYSLGVFNGEGKNKADANKSKDIVARLKINPMKELTLSGSFGYGESGPTYIQNIRYAGGLWWHGRNFYLRTEYLALHQSEAGAERSINGCYAVTGYHIGKFCPLVRYNWMNSDLSGSRVIQSDYLVGIDYHPFRYLRIQANYTRTHYNGAGSSNIVGLAVTGIF